MSDKIINYRKEDYTEILKNYDGVFDTLGSKETRKAFKVLKNGGKIVSITAFPNKKFYKKYKDIYDLSMWKRILFFLTGLQFDILEKKYNVSYEQLFMWSSSEQLNYIKELIENKKIVPIIDKVYSFYEIQEALDYSQSGRAKGKIVVKIK